MTTIVSPPMRILVLAFSVPAEMMGGAEYQAMLLARGLAHLGHDAVFLATNTTEEDRFKAGKVTVLKLPGALSAGRAQHEHLVKKAIREVAPDLCYVRAFPELRTVVPACREAHIPVVSVSTHLLETSPFLLDCGPRDALRYLLRLTTFAHMRCFYSVRYSAAHVCNTKAFQRRIQRWFPQKVIRAIYNGQPVPPPETIHHGSTGQVVWVNNLKQWKRPEIFVELAHRLPEYRFVMVGRMGEGSFAKKIGRVLQQAPANFHYLGPKPIDEVNTLISESDLLLYTSLPVEGFGNSFLQAWFREVPTLSLSFDLDGILEREGIGRFSQTFGELVADVQELMEDRTNRQEMGQRAREYAVSQHSAEKMVADYEVLFKEIVATGQGQASGERRQIAEGTCGTTDHG
jgi:glycosyltransferase involved in cell wall biosynthesis